MKVGISSTSTFFFPPIHTRTHTSPRYDALPWGVTQAMGGTTGVNGAPQNGREEE